MMSQWGIKDKGREWRQDPAISLRGIRMKKKMMAAVCAGAVLCLAFGGSAFAFLSAHRGDITNRFTAGNVTTEISELFPDGQVISLSSDSSKTIRKTVCVRNTGRNDCYVRVSVGFSNGGFGASLSGLNMDDWVKEGDYYYYKSELKSGETTSALFTGITVPGLASRDTGYMEEGDFLDVYVYEESVSTRHGDTEFADYKAAWDFHTAERYGGMA